MKKKTSRLRDNINARTSREDRCVSEQQWVADVKLPWPLIFTAASRHHNADRWKDAAATSSPGHGTSSPGSVTYHPGSTSSAERTFAAAATYRSLAPFSIPGARAVGCGSLIDNGSLNEERGRARTEYPAAALAGSMCPVRFYLYTKEATAVFGPERKPGAKWFDSIPPTLHHDETRRLRYTQLLYIYMY